jgi:hypothetical protein
MCKDDTCAVCFLGPIRVAEVFTSLWKLSFEIKDLKRYRALEEISKATGEFGNSNPS